jgi:hypothetical protein
MQKRIKNNLNFKIKKEIIFINIFLFFFIFIKYIELTLF